MRGKNAVGHKYAAQLTNQNKSKLSFINIGQIAESYFPHKDYSFRADQIFSFSAKE